MEKQEIEPMSECVETLNRWGEAFCAFAGPMFWQSSLLIAVVFAFDLVFARRLRASVRCAFWAVVLVKLVLPPSLALPTGTTWWLWRPHPVVVAPMIQNYTVSFGNTVPDAIPLPTVPVAVPPPKLSGEGWVLVAAAVTAVGLLLWLVFRWLRVAGKVRRAATAPVELDGILEEAQKLAGLRRRPRLKLIDEAQSPAVYGLFRPVILLPRTLANQISERQLRAVLLHEAVHLRRGDVWMNFAQTLLQIAYWWHPLLWVANARIRRLREEAVDDAVMLALRDGADAYAPTLLEVAKFAFRPSLASLGLVGILESRSALRQRVERLMDFRPPRRAGITLLSLCGIFAFCAVALPMGQGPAATADSFSSVESSNDETLTLHVNPDVFIRNIKACAGGTLELNTNDYGPILLDILDREGVDCVPPHGFSFNTKTGEIKTKNTPEQLDVFSRVIEQLNRADGKIQLPTVPETLQRKTVQIKAAFYWMAPADFRALTADATYHRGFNRNAPAWTVDAAQVRGINNRLTLLGLRSFSQTRIETKEGRTANVENGNVTNWIRFGCDPHVQGASIGLTYLAETGLTNRCEVNGTETVGDAGAIIAQAQTDDPSMNLVVIMNVKISDGTALGGTTETDFAGACDAIYHKLDQIHLNVSYSGQSLSEVILDLSRQSRKLDPDKKGINFLFTPNVENTAFAATQIDPATGPPAKGNAPSQAASASQIDISLILKNVDLHDVLKAICLVSDHPIKYSVEDYGVVFSAKGTNSPPYEVRTFRVNPKAFHANLKYDFLSDGLSYGAREDANGHDVSGLAMAFFSKLGINLDPPKAVFYNDRLGILFVYAAPGDLDVIGKAVQVLSGDPPQIRIKARFIEVPKEFLSSAVAKSMFPGLTNGAILTRAEFSLFWREVKSQGGVEEVAEPEVTTISGRQTQMRATVIQEVITNFTLEASAGPYGQFSDGSAYVPQTEQVQTGPIFDVVPDELADGYTINLTTIASRIDFLGYGTPGGLVPNVTTNAAGTGFSPVFNVREASISRNLWDGQTLVLFPNSEAGWRYIRDEKGKRRTSEGVENSNEEKGDKVLIVLTTATLIDAAGNRVHSEGELPFAQNAVPQQSP